MPYEIETQDGIVVRNIPDDIPSDHGSLKARVAKARAERDAEQTPEPGFGRTAGLGARAVIQGVSALPAMAADVIASALNKGFGGQSRGPKPETIENRRSYSGMHEAGPPSDLFPAGDVGNITPNGAVTANPMLTLQGMNRGEWDNVATRTPFSRAPSDSLRGLLTAAGLPEPATPGERFSSDVVGSMAGQAGILRLADLIPKTGPVVTGIGDMMRANPGSQIVGAATGAGASSGAREAGASPGVQTLAGLIGSVVPSVVPAASGELARQVMRGGEAGRARMEGNIRDFEQAGYGTPTVGQASEQRFPRAVESVLAKTPGSAGVMQRTAEAGAVGLGGRVDEISADLAPRASAESAGRAIKAGVQGEAGFLTRFKNEQERLYGVLDQHIPQNAPVNVTRTQAALAELNSDIPGAPNLSEWFKNAKIQGIERAMSADVGQKQVTTPSQLRAAAEISETADGLAKALKEGALPYEAVKKLRTLVGREMADNSLVAEVPKDKWRALYAALSEDLGTAAKAVGPQAEQAWQRANWFTRAGMKRLETLEPVVSKTDPEAVFSAAMSGTKEGATRVRAVLQSLNPDEQKAVAATVVRRMGVAIPGRNNDLGEVFSAESFLTNWNRLSPEAKSSLFNRLGADYRSSLDQIAKVAANLREGSKVFANPSGTQQAISSQMAGGGAILALLNGQPGVAASIGGVALSANAAARAMSSPAITRWFAAATKMPVSAIPAALNSLSQQAMHLPAEDRAAVKEIVEKATLLARP